MYGILGGKEPYALGKTSGVESGDTVEVEWDDVLAELYGVFDFLDPSAVCRKVEEAVLCDDHHDVAGLLDCPEDRLEIVSAGQAPCVQEYAGFTEAALCQFVFRELSLYRTACPAVADENVICQSL